jgi:hypothetical protein
MVLWNLVAAAGYFAPNFVVNLSTRWTTVSILRSSTLQFISGLKAVSELLKRRVDLWP